MTARERRVEIVQLLGIAAAVVAWLGWFEITPALGFPTIGPAAMLNRVFDPAANPGAWLGWAVVVVGLVAVAALYSLATARRWLPPGVVSGLLFGLAVWLIAGAVVMVILGRISPPPAAPPPPPGPPLPTTPDPMHASFMMLHLGALAPINALIAWVLFGAVVGAASATSEQLEMRTARRRPGLAGATAVLVGVVALTVWGSASLHADVAQGSEDVRTDDLAEGPAEALPEGPTFISVIELRQAAGATLGPHAHVPGFAFVLDGRATIAFPDRATMELDPGEGGFMGGLEIHSHESREGRAPAALVALGIVVVAAALAAVSLAGIASRPLVGGLGGLLIVVGAVALWNPWANAWYFIGVRPEASRGGVMPLPNSSRTFESAVLNGVPPGPYTEELRLITVPSGEAFTVDGAPGPEMFLVLNGRAEVRFDGGSQASLDASEAALVQSGASVELSNPDAETLRVLSFRVTGSGQSP
jgi:hypothetical protein